LVVCGGTLAAFAVGRGPMLLVSAGTLAYYTALIGAMYGLSRFRLPLEPLWMLWLAVALANPAAARAGLTGGRLVGGVALTAVLAALMTTYLWTGWPGLG
jgi:energy-coupling factor transporter transmembrane protein EcfT